jgi:hypothetical protein
MNGRRDLFDPSTAIRGSVELIGSRATGNATELSDWDYRIASSNSAAVAARLPTWWRCCVR